MQGIETCLRSSALESARGVSLLQPSNRVSFLLSAPDVGEETQHDLGVSQTQISVSLRP